MGELTNLQRRELRRWHQRQYPRPTHKEAAAWVKEHFKERLSQSQVSRFLSAKYAALDDIGDDSPSLTNMRTRVAEYPILEDILFRWQLSMEMRSIPTSRLLLQQRAAAIWETYPEARNGFPKEPVPAFGSTWLALFQKRFHIRQRKQHRELGSAMQIIDEAGTQRQLTDVRDLCAQYAVGNRYNMDETGLYWRRITSSGLSSEQRPSSKLEKTRISVAVTNNDTGDDRFELWAIGHYKTPDSLRDFNWNAYGARWRHNKRAWMTGAVMADWLRAFYRHIERRKPGQRILLLLDNFSGHETGVKLAPPPSNITVAFLPPNITSIVQPCDMGIINSLKMAYRKRFLCWLGDELDADPFADPVRKMDQRLAMVWLTEAYFETVTQATIINCWRKSTLLGDAPAFGQTVQLPAGLSATFNRVSQSFPNILAMEDFLNPLDEDTPPGEATTDEDMLQQAVDDVLVKEDYRDDDEREAENQYTPLRTSLSQGLVGLRALLTLSEENEVFTAADVAALRSLRRRLKTLISERAR